MLLNDGFDICHLRGSLLLVGLAIGGGKEVLVTTGALVGPLATEYVHYLLDLDLGPAEI